MSAYESTRVAARFAVKRGLKTRSGVLRRLVSVVQTWRARARARAELARLDNLALGDIGLDRTIVDLEVQRSFWQRPLAAWRSQARGRRREPWD